MSLKHKREVYSWKKVTQMVSYQSQPRSLRQRVGEAIQLVSNGVAGNVFILHSLPGREGLFEVDAIKV